MRLRLGVVVVIAMVAIAGCSTAPIPDPMTDTGPESPSVSPNDPVGTTTTETTTEPTTTMVESLADPPSDRLGWESGYWYNETIEVDQSDGLNESELDAVVARGKARVEYIRGLEFNESVPVTIISREEFRNETEERFANRSTESKLHQDVKFEALFFLGEGESAVSQQESNTASNVLGYYSPDNHTIKIVSDNPDSLEMNEITLAQELFHALQSSHFDTGNYTQNTEELHNAKDGIIEGDGNYVDYKYEEACDAGWDCLEPTGGSGSGGGGGDVHIGMWALRFQPYSDGPSFVRDIYEAEGWDGVNAVYEQPPESTEQVIHPEQYREDSPQNVSIEDRSTGEWYVPDQGNGSIDYAQFGEAGVYAMLWYPSYVESQAGNPADVVIPMNHFIERGGDRDLDPYNYSHPYSTGWDGDRLLPYVTNDSATTNETGYVWKLTWDSEADATEFETAYLELLAYHGAEPVPEEPGTYRIADGPYADAFRVTQSGANVTIVNAPTVDELDAVHASPEG